MKVLTNDNTVFDINNIPDQIGDKRYCVLDYSNKQDVDYFFVPLLYLDSFPSAVALIQVGKYAIQLPLDWHILIGDKHVGELELIDLKKLNERDFSAFSFNPISGYRHSFMDIKMIDLYPDTKWHLPKLKFGNLLAVPLGEQSEWPLNRNTGERVPECIFIVKDVNKLPDAMDLSLLV